MKRLTQKYIGKPIINQRKLTIGIRKEDGVLWERRAPFTPDQIKQLIDNQKDLKVLIQPSKSRVFPIHEYIKAGAIEQEDITQADAIIGVKQVPTDQLYANKTYCFFSHTIKAQQNNMQLLDKCLSNNIRLIDYEKIQKDGSGQRLVAFGKWAGVVGAIDIINALGIRMLALGYDTPFLQVGRAHNYDSVEHCYKILKNQIETKLFTLKDKLDSPLTVVFTGNGNVSKGAQEVFQQLNITFIKPTQLEEIKKSGDCGKIYGTIVSSEDHLLLKLNKNKKFDKSHYKQNSSLYESNFSTKIAPFMNVLVNGIIWYPGDPRLLSNNDLKNLKNLYAVSDVTADPGGSLEFMSDCTMLDEPFKFYNIDNGQHKSNFTDKNGFIYCSVDNMPTQVAKEATNWFGLHLLPFMNDILNTSNMKINLNDLEKSGVDKAITQACITSDGKLTPRFEYIEQLRNGKSKLAKPKSALILGAGMVSGPLVEYLDSFGIKQSLATVDVKDAESLINKCKTKNATAISLNLEQETDKLEQLLNNHDIVISLVPYTLHPIVAKSAIKTKTNMITASYLSDNLKNLDDKTKSAGIFCLNELGLDPGIDHMLAMECFDNIKKESGNDIKSFISFCGGLPAPESTDNALRYKFSWSPTGVLMAATNPAIYNLNNKQISIDHGGEILKNTFPVNFYPGFNMESIANRDSTVYKDAYKLDKVETILRGTLRFKPYCDVIYGLQKIGLLDSDEPIPDGATCWADVVNKLDYKTMIGLSGISDEESEVVVNAMKELNLLSTTKFTPKVKASTSLLEAFANHLSQVCKYDENERDLVALRHEIVEHESDKKHVIDFVHYGDPNGWSAMAKTVSLPAAIGARMALDGKLDGNVGMIRPFDEKVYGPILKELRGLGLFSRYKVE